MNDCILQLRCLQNKTATIYRGGVRMLIPLPSLVCMTFSRVMDGEMQNYKRFASASKKERKQIKEKLLTNFIEQKQCENEIEYGHPYIKSWNKMIVNLKDDEITIANGICTSFWQDINDEHKLSKPKHSTFKFVHNGHNNTSKRMKNNLNIHKKHSKRKK